MPTIPESRKKPSTWQSMVDNNKALLVRKTGEDTAHWVEKARRADRRAVHQSPALEARKGYVSLHSPRRKFAQVSRTTNTAVDLTLRLEAPAEGRIETVKTRADDPSARRVRLTSTEHVDDRLLEILALALKQNS